MTLILMLLGLLLAGAAALGALFLGGMRTKWPPVVKAVRQANRRLFNPRQMATAGQPGAFAGILRHTGRRSGTLHETPVGIEPTEDGFVIALVYGDDTQWLRNVMAAGHAEIVKDGVTYRVDRPRLVPVGEVIEAFRPGDRRLFRLFGVERCLRLYRVEP